MNKKHLKLKNQSQVAIAISAIDFDENGNPLFI